MLLSADADRTFTPVEVLTNAVAFCAAMDANQNPDRGPVCFKSLSIEKEVQETRPSIMKVRFGIATVEVTAQSNPNVLAARIASPRRIHLPNE